MSCRTAASMSMAHLEVLSKTRNVRRPAHLRAAAKARRCISTRSTSRSGECWRSSRRRLLAGVPAIVKPATATAISPSSSFRRIVESGILPEGALQLDLRQRRRSLRSSHLPGRRRVHRLGQHCAELRKHADVIAHSVRFIAETDSLNSSMLGPDAAPGTPGVRPVRARSRARDDRRRRDRSAPRFARHRAGRASGRGGRGVQGGAREDRRRRSAARKRAHGPARALAQRREVMEQLAKLRRETELVHGGDGKLELGRRGSRRKARSCRRRCFTAASPRAPRRFTTVEAFGPVCTVMPYEDRRRGHRARAARRGQPRQLGVHRRRCDRARTLVLGLAPYHGRVLVVNRHCAKESTGHGSPLPHLVHGGPGRAGGGEEMGGIRGVLHYMQRTAIQGSPSTITRGHRRMGQDARRADARRRIPFRKSRFTSSRLATRSSPASAKSPSRTSRRFAELSGDHFYAHMDEHGGGAQSALRRARRARLFPDLGGGGPVRRAARTARCSPTMASMPCASSSPSSPAIASRCASPARRNPCARHRATARSAGTRRSPIRRRDRRRIRCADDGERAGGPRRPAVISVTYVRSFCCKVRRLSLEVSG